MRNGQISLADCRNNIARCEKRIAESERKINAAKNRIERCKGYLKTHPTEQSMTLGSIESLRADITLYRKWIREDKTKIKKYQKIQADRLAKGFKV